MNSKIISKKPFWWFLTGRKWGTVAMTWGSTIYCKEDQLRPDIIAHEEVHIKQCKGKWYISLWFLIRSTFDDKFYQKLEHEAKMAQMKVYFYENNRNNGSRTKREISHIISG